MRLAGKVALITGAGGGMGREAALLFAAEGARVVVADVRQDAAEKTAAAIRATGGEGLAVRCDVAVPEDNRAMVDAAVARYGGLHVFYANAGIVDRRPDGGDVGLERISLETWQRILAVNLTGVFLGCRYAIPAIVKAGGGSVILTASIGALVAHRAHNHAYVASKAAVLGLARNLAVEYAPHRVRVNCLCPGQIHTPMMEPFVHDPARAQDIIARTPMGRFGQAREVAQVALFLASDESSFMTGAAVVVDGGWTAL
ncbi:MAG: glucose 1-dehydrogenase [Armatimonadota bacterium]|nr:glucose 1-dehydrogenase [Armatimonadota bacterium]